ncbi:MAG: cytochrome c [Chitinophagales bacterium]
MKRTTILLLSSALLFFIVACGKKSTTETASGDKPKSMFSAETDQEKMIKEGYGIGEVKNVELASPLDQSRVSRGKDIYDMKCSACHKLTEERFVGPGWLNVTHRRKPEWIMNMITNVDVMLERDPNAQDLLKLCMTRMPNQNMSVGDARDVLEYMRQNDGEK